MPATLGTLQKAARQIPIHYTTVDNLTYKSIPAKASLSEYINDRLNEDANRERSLGPLTTIQGELNQRYGRKRENIFDALDGFVSALYEEASPADLRKAERKLKTELADSYIFYKGPNIFEWQPDGRKISAVVNGIKAVVEKKMGKTQSAAEVSDTPDQSSIAQVHTDGKGLRSGSHKNMPSVKVGGRG